MAKNKGMVSVRGYFERAKMFGLIVIAVLVFEIFYYLYKAFLG